jgi:5-amino-6-(D-ribitylamino)uracil---L-tyrosine 4-hydroxyphenyl transferase
VITQTIDAILDRALAGQDLSEAEGVVLLKQTEAEPIAAIQQVADRLRQRM